jgi:EAL domain-containing protein (putative c-di-GMP-specific phosphodiesterase class I)
VEKPVQAEWLAAAGCAYGQVYLWARPMPLADAVELLANPSGIPTTKHRQTAGVRAHS